MFKKPCCYQKKDFSLLHTVAHIEIVREAGSAEGRLSRFKMYVRSSCKYIDGTHTMKEDLLNH